MLCYVASIVLFCYIRSAKAAVLSAQALCPQEEIRHLEQCSSVLANVVLRPDDRSLVCSSINQYYGCLTDISILCPVYYSTGSYDITRFFLRNDLELECTSTPISESCSDGLVARLLTQCTKANTMSILKPQNGICSGLRTYQQCLGEVETMCTGSPALKEESFLAKVQSTRATLEAKC